MFRRDLRQEWHQVTARPWLLMGEMESGEMESVVLSGRSQRHGCVREVAAGRLDRGARSFCRLAGASQSRVLRHGACFGLVAGRTGVPLLTWFRSLLIVERRRPASTSLQATLQSTDSRIFGVQLVPSIHHSHTHRRRHVADPRHVRRPGNSSHLIVKLPRPSDELVVHRSPRSCAR